MKKFMIYIKIFFLILITSFIPIFCVLLLFSEKSQKTPSFIIYGKQYINRKNQEIFWAIIAEGNVSKLKDFLSVNGTSLINTRDKQGDTPLLDTINGHEPQMTTFLLANGADPNLPSLKKDLLDKKTYSFYPFYAACDQDKVNFNLLDSLLKHGADIDVGISVNGKVSDTPLMRACLVRNIDAIKYLLDHNANVKIKDENGFSALDFAILCDKYKDKKEKLSIIKLLMNHGAIFNPNQRLRMSKLTMKEFVEKKLGKDVLDILESKQKIK